MILPNQLKKFIVSTLQISTSVTTNPSKINQKQNMELVFGLRVRPLISRSQFKSQLSVNPIRGEKLS